MAARNPDTSVVFKRPLERTPLPATKGIRKQEILAEDEYTQDLENIIERDFFPDLRKMRAHLEYREALETNDVTKLRELLGKYGSRLDSARGSVELGDDGKSPSTFETPLVDGGEAVATPSVASSSAVPPTRADADHGDGKPSTAIESSMDSDSSSSSRRVANRGLDSYLASNTSEDNASFAAIMEEADRKHRLKYAWLYEKEAEHAKYADQCLALPSIEQQQQFSDDGRRITATLDTWTYTNKNSVMYVPEGAELTATERQSLVISRPQVMHTNTRFRRLPFNEQVNREAICAAAQLQARSKEGKIGVDGKELAPTDEPPHVGGYGFVVTPSPAPGVDESPMMTWGEIEGTPFRLDGGIGGGGGGGQTPITGVPSFHIAAVPNRDRLAKKLAEKVSKQHREKKRIALQAVKATLASPSPMSSHVERLASMSPAVQRLASSQLRINLGDPTLRQSYTPTRTPKSSSSGDYARTPVQLQTTNATFTVTPTAVRGSVSKGAVTPSSSSAAAAAFSATSLTDDLLNLPKKARARDFFNE